MKLFIYVILSNIILLSCSKATSPIASNFDENINIKLFENIDSNKRTFDINMYTDKIYNCDNYNIITNVTFNNNKLKIVLIEVKTPEICLTALGPAREKLSFDNMPIGNYDVELVFKSGVVLGQLVISSSSYKLTFTPSSKIKVVNPTLNKVPNQTIFGKVHYHFPATAFQVQNYIDSLKILGAISNNYIVGDYGHFKIDSNGAVVQTQQLGYNNTKHFVFNYANTNSKPIEKLTKNFGARFPDSLLIDLKTSKGENFMSWIR